MPIKANDALCVCPCTQLARRFVIRDMGNGVERVEMASILSLDAAKEECRLPDRTPIPMHPGVRILDACSVALSPALNCSNCVQSGCVSAIDEYAIELIVWRRG